CGLNIDPYVRSSKIGRVRRLYVLQAERHRGIGQALVANVTSQAKLAEMQEVRVRVGNPDSNGFFLRLGFTPAGQAAAYTHHLLLSD
ncbi:MAG: GNAT family N-acetyltransferase, partial [Cyanobacteria bacterium Co-bin13]|nr:GNAT family N-acetyltransferase [Cyanobacteria bacterium Co-bin13]